MGAGTTSSLERVILVAATVSLLAASAVHFGIRVPLGGSSVADPFRGAAIPELILGVLLGGATLSRFAGWRHSRGAVLAAALLTFAAAGYGLSVTVRGRLEGDIAYHAALLLMLVLALGLLAGRRDQEA